MRSRPGLQSIKQPGVGVGTMPKVKNYSAGWLSEGSHGHKLFAPSADTLRSRALSPSYSSKKKPVQGPRRTIARRGTEVFVAVGREIRWGDLAYLKEDWAQQQARARSATPGSRVKREGSVQPMEIPANFENAGGLRVSRIPGEFQAFTDPPSDNQDSRGG